MSQTSEYTFKVIKILMQFKGACQYHYVFLFSYLTQNQAMDDVPNI